MKAYETTTAELQDSPQLQATWLEKQLLKTLRPILSQTEGSLVITFPSGHQTVFGTSGDQVQLKLNNYRPLLRLLFGGFNGWSESYLAGEWDSTNLTALVRWALNNEQQLLKLAKAGFVTQSLHNLYHKRRNNSRKGSKRNISAHYDLGNNFYKHWLDPSMTYSAALYAYPGQPLAEAQANKNARIIELLDSQAGDNIVEIGCGWGGFALQASKDHQLNVEGITLSKEQLKWAQQQIDRHQLNDQVQLSLTDYRDLNKQFDGVVSIEMFEAVGEEHWDSYFATLQRVLKPGGKAVLQVISIDDERFHGYRKQADFIQRYIFPGGMLPSISALQDKITEHGFRLEQKQLFGLDYAQTLREWCDAFENNWQQIRDYGFDDRFYRLWRYYLAYCEGGFENGSIDVGFYVISHDQR